MCWFLQNHWTVLEFNLFFPTLKTFHEFHRTIYGNIISLFLTKNMLVSCKKKKWIKSTKRVEQKKNCPGMSAGQSVHVYSVQERVSDQHFLLSPCLYFQSSYLDRARWGRIILASEATKPSDSLQLSWNLLGSTEGETEECQCYSNLLTTPDKFTRIAIDGFL